MSPTPKQTRRSAISGGLTASRAEKINLVEGLQLTPRMADAIAQGKKAGLNGDEQRAKIKAKFKEKLI